ncbi:MAG: site-2 protease family protein [Acutalibacteraceae bacterium]|nr:site-2 protease family protein [Acutalibacteraceae bacterium]
MIFDFIEAIKDADVMSVISILLSSAILIFLCFPVHESAHAWAAYHMGDGTARSQGRISLNPTKHLDLLGTAMMLICGVGYAKPVPVNPFFFKNRKLGMAITAIAGPISNFIMAIIAVFIYVLNLNVLLPLIYRYEFGLIACQVINIVFFYIGWINISLGIFNMIPVPPFDGSRILTLILPERIYFKIMQYERVIFYVFMALLLFGFLDGYLSTACENVFNALVHIFSIPFGGLW